MTRYGVYENDKLCLGDNFECMKGQGGGSDWKGPAIFDTFNEAMDYCKKWLGGWADCVSWNKRP